MNKNVVTLIVSAAAVTVCGIGWFSVPALQDARKVVESEASVELERARRLLDRYNASLSYGALLTDQLADQGIEPDPEDLSDDVADDYQELHAAMWEAYQPADWPKGGSPRPAQARYGNLPLQIRTGLAEAPRLVRKNEELLNDAQRAVDRALAVTEGGESSRSHAEANRLKSVVLYHKGQAKRLQAKLQRRESDRHRRELLGLASEGMESQSMGTLVADSEIRQQIDALEAKAAELGAAIGEDRKALAAIDARIGDLEPRLLAAEERAEQALETMDRLKAEGVDFSDPDGAEKFQMMFVEQDRIYRRATREAHALRYGTYSNIGEGPDNEPAVEHGLRHHQNERAVLAATIDGQERALEGLRTDVTRLEGIEEAYQATQDQAVQRITESAATASEAYTELNRIDSEAYVIEDEAFELFDRSQRTAEQAAGYADRWLADARERTQGLSREAQQRSAYGSRLRDGWMGGYVAALEADAHLAKAWIHYTRYDTYTQNANVLAKVAQLLQLGEADAESERAKAEEAHDAGVDEINATMEVLERVHNKTERHWTVTAQAAGATYLLALFGHEDYVEEAIEAYGHAVEGREDDAFAQPFVSSLSRLEER